MHIIFDSGLPQPRSYQHPHINNTTQHLSTNIKYVNISCSFFPCSYSVYVLLVYQPQQPFYKLTEFPSFFLSTRHILPIFPPHPPTKLQTSLSLQSSSSEIATSPTSCTNPLIFRMALKKILWFPVCIPSLTQFWGAMTFNIYHQAEHQNQTNAQRPYAQSWAVLTTCMN